MITPHQRIGLGPTKLPRPLQALLNEVHWISLEELSRQILTSRPDLETVVLPMLVQRFPHLTEEQIMVIAGIPREEIRHTRAVQDWLAEGRQEGERP